MVGINIGERPRRILDAIASVSAAGAQGSDVGLEAWLVVVAAVGNLFKRSPRLVCRLRRIIWPYWPR
eukprot:1688552-Alexandrium_andersonii.AAC.1